MGNCKDCKHWARVHDTSMGVCERLSVEQDHNRHQVFPVNPGWVAATETLDTFGCVLFEQKPKGPFRVIRVAEPVNSRELIPSCCGELIFYKIMFAGNCVDPGRRAGVLGKEATEELVNWLNDLWEQKECGWTGPVCSDCTRDKLERSHEYWKDCT